MTTEDPAVGAARDQRNAALRDFMALNDTEVDERAEQLRSELEPDASHSEDVDSEDPDAADFPSDGTPMGGV